MRKAILGTGALGLLAVGLACSGLGIGPGANVATAPVSPGQATVLTHTAVDTEPVGVWLTYDLGHSGGDYHLVGPFEIRVGGQVVRSTQLDFGPEGGALADTNTRMTWGTYNAQINGVGSASGRVWLAEVAPSAAGVPIEVRLTAVPAHTTTVNALSVDITQ